MSICKLLSVSADAKTKKGQKRGWLTGVLYLSPHRLSGRNVCHSSTPQCRALCLNLSGRGRFAKIQQARIRKTQWLTRDQNGFLEALVKDIEALIRKANRMDMDVCVRLNGTSDLPWQDMLLNGDNLMQLFPMIQFYDYTKVALKMRRYMHDFLPGNYHLTFSRSESNDSMCRDIIENTHHNVSVVFNGALPETFMGRPVFRGDDNDLRFLDPKGVVVGLTAKGLARKSVANGFVIQSEAA